MVPLRLHIKFQPNIPRGSENKFDFNGLDIFSYSGHFFYSRPGWSFSLRSPAPGHAACEI